MRKNKKYEVVFSDGSYSHVAMTPALAEKLAKLAQRPVLISKR